MILLKRHVTYHNLVTVICKVWDSSENHQQNNSSVRKLQKYALVVILKDTVLDKLSIENKLHFRYQTENFELYVPIFSN